MNFPYDYKSATREDVQAYLETVKQHVETVERHLVESSGAHQTLVALCNEGFELPECDGGWDFVEDPKRSLSDAPGQWGLTVEARYEHDDDRGGQFTRDCTFYVVDGRLKEGYGRYAEDLADANDLEACKQAVSEAFFTDGG